MFASAPSSRSAAPPEPTGGRCAGRALTFSLSVFTSFLSSLGFSFPGASAVGSEEWKMNSFPGQSAACNVQNTSWVREG